MILVGAILLALFVLPSPWGAAAIVAGIVIEVGESAFWIWLSKRRRPQVGAETLIGASAEVVADCRPVGRVRVQGELWSARCEEGARRGERVRIQAIDGLMLVVER
jgi:membrane protein implicated in regulation of membrane protease activity